ncbi:MAG: hypothetical protein Q8O25_09860 [Sulfurisoma sp.]|nr:hypothetical protein [Sulfurisoma sp.]
MRTTLDIADDVLFAAKDVARREKKTVGQLVSELMRRALSSPAAAHTGDSANPPASNEIDTRFREMGFCTLPSRGGIVTNELINQLREREGI